MDREDLKNTAYDKNHLIYLIYLISCIPYLPQFTYRMVLFSHISFSNGLNIITTDEHMQQSRKQDYFKHNLKYTKAQVHISQNLPCNTIRTRRFRVMKAVCKLCSHFGTYMDTIQIQISFKNENK